MKKFTVLTLAVIMIVTVLLPSQAFAEYDKDLEKAIVTAKTLFDIPEEYDTFNYSMNKQDDITSFYLRWSDKKQKLGGIEVNIDSKGKILYFYSYKPYKEYDSQHKFPVISKERGYDIAIEFISKIAPEIRNNIKYEKGEMPANVNDRYYNYRFIRIENDIPYYSNSINLSVDNTTGEINNYWCDWTDELEFPDTQNTMDIEKAQQVFEEKLGLKLVYQLKYENNVSTPYLAYVSVHSGKSIDAKTGEIVEAQNYFFYNQRMKEFDSAMNMGSGASVVLTPQEKEAIGNIADIMTEQSAEKKAREILDIDKSFILRNINLYNSFINKEDFVWSIGFNKEEKKDGATEYYYIDISLNAKTGEVLSFNKSLPYNSDAKVKYNEEQSLKIVTDFIKSLQPVKFQEVEYTDWGRPVYRPMADKEMPRNYYFTFTRKDGNAYFLDNGMNVNIDTTTGTITSYNFNWYKGELPSAQDIIDSDAAHSKLFGEIGIEMQYIADYSSESTAKIIPPMPTDRKPAIKLVYAIKPQVPVNIDAYTGKLLDHSGKPYEKYEVPQYADIQGHYAENQINLLAEYGIALPAGEFRPSELITQKEFLYLLGKSIGTYYITSIPDNEQEEEDFYRVLINLGIIKAEEKDSQAHVTRQDAVKFIIRALKYDKVGDIKGIFSIPFSDADQINPELYGYVAIAHGLCIVKGNNGVFRPLDSVSRAEAAVMIFNYLNIE